MRFILLLFVGCLAWGQTFEAASVKPAVPPVPDAQGRILMRGPSGGPGSKDPGRINYPNQNMRALVMNAYDVKSFQVSGPVWLDTERFDLTATMPPETRKEQFRIMLQNLLAERFKLTVHRESKELPIYSLIVGKGGAKFKESEPPPPSDGETPSLPPLPPGGPKFGPDGFPILNIPKGAPGGPFIMMMPGRGRLLGQLNTMQELTDRLSSLLSRPVTNATGLTAKYDFVLSFATDGLSGPMGPLPLAPPPGGGGRGGPGAVDTFVPDGETPPDIFAAVQSQLGLKLEPKKGPVSMIVIDHAEKTPIEN